MPSEDGKETFASLEATNAELRDSLKRCRAMRADYRTKLTANSNDPPLFRWNQQRMQANGDAIQSSEPKKP